jgi:hypothetical protein
MFDPMILVRSLLAQLLGPATPRAGTRVVGLGALARWLRPSFARPVAEDCD